MLIEMTTRLVVMSLSPVPGFLFRRFNVNDKSAPVLVYVTYEGTSADRFDRDYYRSHHLPLVSASWAKHGLESCRGFFPTDDASGTVAICELRFRDEAAVEAAFSSAEAPTVMADVATYTDLAPKRRRALLM